MQKSKIAWPAVISAVINVLDLTADDIRRHNNHADRSGDYAFFAHRVTAVHVGTLDGVSALLSELLDNIE